MSARGASGKKRRRASTAPGQGLGFSLQVTRLLARLLQDCSAGDYVCLEAFGDVGVVRTDGSMLAEETKSTHGYNPVSDRAPSLWKTLANWLDAVKAGSIPARRSHFVLYVSTPVELGRLGTNLQEARTREDALKALRTARSYFWGDPPEFQGRTDLPGELATQIARLWSETTVSPHLLDIVANMRFAFGSGSPIADIHELVSRELIGAEHVDACVRWSLGWVKVETDKLLERGIPAYIAYDSFREALLNFVRTCDRVDMLRGYAGEPSADDVASERQLQAYVRQLEIVAVDEEDVLAAINDHLKAATDRTVWAAKGLVDEPGLLEYERELKRTWRNYRDQVAITRSGADAVERGRLIFRQCEGHRATVNGLTCPTYFTPGSFHAIANTLAIGWHPEYRKLLADREGVE